MPINGSRNRSSAGTLLADRRVTVNSRKLQSVLAQNNERDAAARVVLRAESARVLFENRIKHIGRLVREGVVAPKDIKHYLDLAIGMIEKHMHSDYRLKAVCALDAMRSTASIEEIRPVLAEAERVLMSVEGFLNSTATLGAPRRQIA